MDTLFDKLKEYLAMDTEIPFDEFNGYYKELIAELNANFNGYNQDDCLKAICICLIVRSNADARATRSKANAKSFKKIGAKCAFWEDAINYRLRNEGMSASAIEEAVREINDKL